MLNFMKFACIAAFLFVTAFSAFAEDNGNSAPAPAPAPAPEQPKSDAPKPDPAIVALYEKLAKAIREFDAEGLVNCMSKKGLKETADKIRGYFDDEQKKAGVEKLGLAAEDRKLDDKALSLKYWTAMMKKQKERSEKEGKKNDYKMEVVETKIDGDKATAKAKATRLDGTTLEKEDTLVREDGAWKFDEYIH